MPPGWTFLFEDKLKGILRMEIGHISRISLTQLETFSLLYMASGPEAWTEVCEGSHSQFKFETSRFGTKYFVIFDVEYC